MSVGESDPYSRLVRNTTRGVLVIGICGAAIGCMNWGWRAGLGFLFGAALSYLSFWRWRRLTEALTGAGSKQSLLSMLLRLALLIFAAYAIISYLEVRPEAIFLGLLASAAAVILSIVLELIYGT